MEGADGSTGLGLSTSSVYAFDSATTYKACLYTSKALLMWGKCIAILPYHLELI